MTDWIIIPIPELQLKKQTNTSVFGTNVFVIYNRKVEVAQNCTYFYAWAPDPLLNDAPSARFGKEKLVFWGGVCPSSSVCAIQNQHLSFTDNLAK